MIVSNVQDFQMTEKTGLYLFQVKLFKKTYLFCNPLHCREPDVLKWIINGDKFNISIIIKFVETKLCSL